MKKILSILVAALLCTGINAQQLTEGFDDTQFPSDGWTVNNIDSYSGWKRTELSGEPCAVVNGTYGTAVNGSYLITPELKPASGEKLTFSARVNDYASKGELRVEVSTTGTDISSFTVLDTYYTKKDVANSIWKTDWSTFTIDLADYVGQRIFIAFHQYNDADKIYLDNVKGVSLAGNAACETPANLTVSNLTDEGATITWEGDAAEYEYVLVPQGEAPAWTAGVTTTQKSVTITGLYGESAFDFYVRALCGEGEVSLAPKVSFNTTCLAQSVPWIETFTRDATGAIAPECWTVASQNPQVWVVADKTYDDEGNAQTIYGQAHLYAGGGGTNTEQVFAMPAFDAQLNTLEVAFDYKTSMATEGYGVLEVGYMTNPSDASTFVSVKTLPQTLTYVHEICTLEALPADAKFVAFRFAGGTSDFSGVSMDNFVVAAIGHSSEIDPADEVLPDAEIWGLTYCEAQFTWYSYNSEAFAIGLFSAEQEALIGGILCTTEECDRFAYTDGIQFSEYDDYENHYYCSTKWILNVDDGGVQKGDAWANCVINVGTTVNPQLGLKPGKYQVQVYAYSTTIGKGDKLATINFELVSKEVTNLQATVAEDKKTATLTWEQPALSTGERLFVDIRAGETIAYNNYDDTKQKAVSPLTVDVIEGNSYTAYVQIVDKNNNPLGAEVVCNFTVGENLYEPKNPHAEVFGGDNVTFTWSAEAEADRYVITLYCDGEFYTTLNVIGTTKTTTMPKDGTWTWTVQPFNIGSNGNYYEASNPVEGNAFVSKGADIPEDAIVFDIWAFEAAYLDKNSAFYQEGKHGWFLQFATGEEGNQLPAVYMLIYTNKEFAISGVYNVARANIDLESCSVDVTGNQSDAIIATDAEIRLQFDGYDEEKAEAGYRYGYYTGQFRLVGSDGKTYVAKFMELFCNSYNFSSMSTGLLDHKGMWDEDPDYMPWDAVEDVLVEHGFDPNAPMYNIMGIQVDQNYKGIVIQNGKKVMLQ